MIFGKSHEKCCDICEKGKSIVNSYAIICKKKGIVEKGYVCRHFKYDPLKRVPGRKKAASLQFSPEDFSIE